MISREPALAAVPARPPVPGRPLNVSTGTAVVGGGVIGLSVAWELAQRGHRVAVVEGRAKPGSDESAADRARDRSHPAAIDPCTSWTAAGILPPANFELATDPLDRFRGFSHRLWPDWADRLKQASQVDTGLLACGGYYLAETAGEAAAMMGMIDYWGELDIECRSLSRADLLARQPVLSHWIENNPWLKKHPDRAAWWVPDEYQVRPPRLLRALRIACLRSGVQFLDRTSITSIEDSPSSVKLYAGEAGSGQAEVARAQRVVLCGGAAAGTIDAAIGLQNSLIPVRGQILLLQCHRFSEPAVLNIGNRYLVSRGDGHVLVGSCEEEAGFAQHTTESMIGQLRSFAAQVFPPLADAPEVKRWAGLRPMTFDGFPMLGQVPGRKNVLVAAGHYRSGIHFSPATAVAMADMIQGTPPFMDLSAFSVSLDGGSPSQPRSGR
ncbi:NAD(P)/FAD-dependent oxidoreductase [Allorhodopirellula solitaria]|uniref:Hydrogen cyanide synthase subunit HcnC n=1 Tax=Allorhodopirellula solitaria TaxID=2527987 RepID=A0A5C5X194_9BACT|nr:FAD-dependent oxidoreductase [Allorhodopirellula solitaria]TWT56638.1 Hydrogen cyanide synthase subunit HcnC precursor [Allorhodopirellula solitaria]